MRFRRSSTPDVHPIIAEVGAWTILAKVPDAVLVLDDGGQVVHRNEAALTLSDQVTRARGAEILQAMRQRLGEIARSERAFPCTRIVEVEHDGHHAEAEMIINKLPRGFTAVWRDITMVRDTARATESVARALGDASTDFVRLGEQLGRDASEVSARADSVAAGTEELSASIGSVASGAAAAASGTGIAVQAASTASHRLEKLVKSSADIGQVTALIQGIAAQTNLLALNATIEAARAGEAGKGFAVVAGEVKDLAGRTGDATQEISTMVAAIQADTADALAAIEEIVSRITDIEAQQTTVAGAVEQQTATAAEISSSVGVLAQAAGSSSEVAKELLTAAEMVASKAEALRDLL